MMQIHSLVIGGGLAGISIGNALYQQKIPFVLIEAEERLGGKIETCRTEGACFEFGPHSFVAKSPDILRLIDDLGLRTALIPPHPDAQHRYILKHGKPVRLPSKAAEIITTHSLSFLGKLRLMKEYFYVKKRAVAVESVAGFFTRHFGKDVTTHWVDPFVSGIFAGDPEKLSIDAAFPTLVGIETTHRSVLRYLKKERPSPPPAYELRGGLGQLFQSAHEKWGAAVHLGEPVTSIEKTATGFRVFGEKDVYDCKRLYVTSPAPVSARLLKNLAPQLGEALARIDYPELAVAHVRISKKQAYPFQGFGLLVPKSEGRRILGCLWQSSAFPDLFADKAHHYLTVYCGGARDREISVRQDEEIARTALSELSAIFQLDETPELIHFKRHRHAIPQYTLDYATQFEPTIVREAQKIPHLYLAGNYLGGIAMADTVHTALEAVKREGKSEES